MFEKQLRMRASTEKWPLGPTSKLGRMRSGVLRFAKPKATWDKPRPTGDGHRILPNMGDVMLRGRSRHTASDLIAKYANAR